MGRFSTVTWFAQWIVIGSSPIFLWYFLWHCLWSLWSFKATVRGEKKKNGRNRSKKREQPRSVCFPASRLLWSVRRASPAPDPDSSGQTDQTHTSSTSLMKHSRDSPQSTHRCHSLLSTLGIKPLLNTVKLFLFL